ncbi:hypothetical protein B0H11DRAFT_2166577 [Mycena galericulata]|nr:hypothetical protein B0H11DRAFT_2166577 [Mycena galericulata]
MSRNRGGRPRVRPTDNDFAAAGFGDGEETVVTADRGVYFSLDGRRRQDELLNVSHKKRCVNPNALDDRLAQWIPIPDDDLASTDEEPPISSAGDKRKRYESSDDPMSKWRPMKQFFMDAMLWHDGLGDHDIPTLRCALCAAEYKENSEEAVGVRLFKCRSCGEFIQCQSCCLDRHERNPLHLLKEWTGSFWEDRTLKSLGLIYQLGHGGAPCIFPDPMTRTMTVLEHPYIHQIHFRYCGCNKSDHNDHLQQLLQNAWYPATVGDPGTCATFTTLETFRLQNVVGNMNVHDFVTSMERQTNATGSTGMDRVPTRYKEFMRMSRQWAFLQRMKRAGRGHDTVGIDATARGECTVVCWACPYDGRNLPPDWRDVDPRYQFLYMLIIALDANFKLKNRMRANAHDDPPLGPGREYFVDPVGYREHLKNYVPEKDISSCIAFAALLQKDTRSTAGLRCTGVGGCVCARHECVRPNGIGDLQKGERYANMDYIALCALLGFALLWLTISYDIACQWKRTLRLRMEKMPQDIQLNLDDIKWQCALPVWHAASHEEECQNANSLSFKPGVGKSDGEGVERTWAILNPAANHTKDMNIGNREDTLNDKIDNHNFLKNIGQGYALEQKLIIAIAERARQVSAYTEVTRTVEKDLRHTWQKQINDWLADPTNPNPYVLDKSDVPSEAQVRLELKKEEEAEARAGRTPIHGTSATAFLTAGMQLEDAQRRIIAEVNGLTLIAPDKESKLQDRRFTLLSKLAKFRDLQAIFMPGAARLLAAAEEARDSESAPPRPEHIKLWMPHELDDDERDMSCVRGLAQMEARLRVSQCLNALVLLRSRLHAKRHFLAFSNSNIAGQKGKTKAQTLGDEIGERVTASAERYRQGRSALLRLQGEAMDAQFRELKKEDIQLDGDYGETDAAAKKKLAMLGSGRGARAPRNAPGTSKRVMSWIWTAQGGAADGEEHLHDSVRVEWCRARARKLRWEEEVLLVREEMRRVIRYLDWQAAFWEERAEKRPDATRQVQAGAKAYARKQAWVHRRIAAHFQQTWNTPARLAAQRVLAGPLAVDLEGADLDEFFQQ